MEQTPEMELFVWYLKLNNLILQMLIPSTVLLSTSIVFRAGNGKVGGRKLGNDSALNFEFPSDEGVDFPWKSD